MSFINMISVTSDLLIRIARESNLAIEAHVRGQDGYLWIELLDVTAADFDDVKLLDESGVFGDYYAGKDCSPEIVRAKTAELIDSYLDRNPNSIPMRDPQHPVVRHRDAPLETNNPQATSGRELLKEAIAVAIEQHDVATLELGVEAVMTVYKDCGFKPYDGGYGSVRHDFRQEILQGILKRRFAGDERKASGFYSGFLWFRDGSGFDLTCPHWCDQESFEAGRAENPEYAKHLAAKAVADNALREKFRASDLGNRKARLYWSGQYARAIRGGAA